jgi:hypothetical protein
MSTSDHESGRRTAGGRRISPTGVLAVVLPLLTVGALSLVQPDATQTVMDALQTRVGRGGGRGGSAATQLPAALR